METSDAKPFAFEMINRVAARALQIDGGVVIVRKPSRAQGVVWLIKIQ